MSPIEANSENLDFIIAFYQSGTMISASIINGYTINQTRLAIIDATIVNNYNDNGTVIQGNKIPSLLKISGSFTLEEVGSNIISSIGVHLPPSISLHNFVESSNSNIMGCSTADCTAFLGGISLSGVDNWIQQTNIQISSLPSLTE